jgi:hypothetical protein
MPEVTERLIDFETMRKAFRLESGVLVLEGAVPDSKGCSGMASVVRVGLWNRESFACALIERQGEVWLHWGKKAWRLGEAVQLRRTFVAPFVRRFRLFEAGARVPTLDYLYWYRARNDGFPDDGDFLRYAVETTRTSEETVRFGCVWSVSREGEYSSGQEKVDAIEACVRRRLNP